jgi:hypothetical protein
MKIKLWGHYSNIRASIPAGEYDTSDERLQGLGGYLVESGHAIVTEADAPKAASPTATITVVSDPATTVLVSNVVESDAVALEELNDLRRRYEELAGKKVFNGWDAETLLAKIVEMESSLALNAPIDNPPTE